MTDGDPIGKPANFALPPDAIVQFKIGDEVCQGSAVRIQRYRTWGRREVWRLELLEAVLIEGGRL